MGDRSILESWGKGWTTKKGKATTSSNLRECCWKGMRKKGRVLPGLGKNTSARLREGRQETKIVVGSPTCKEGGGFSRQRVNTDERLEVTSRNEPRKAVFSKKGGILTKEALGGKSASSRETRKGIGTVLPWVGGQV